MVSDHQEEFCAAHSGMETKSNLILWLLGTLIGLVLVSGATQLVMTTSLSNQMAGFTVSLAAVAKQNDELKAEIAQLKATDERYGARIDALERK